MGCSVAGVGLLVVGLGVGLFFVGNAVPGAFLGVDAPVGELDNGLVGNVKFPMKGSRSG